MANKRLTQVKINSNDVSSDLIKWRIKRNFGDPIDTAEMTFTKNVTDTVTLQEGQDVEIWMGYSTATDTKVFNGDLDTYEPQRGLIKVKAKNELYALVRKIINAKIYDKSVGGDPINPDGKVSDCFEDIINTYGELNGSTEIVLEDSEDNWSDWDFHAGDAIAGVQESSLVDEGSSATKLGVDASKHATQESSFWLNDSTISADLSGVTGVSSGQPISGKIYVRVATDREDLIDDVAPTGAAWQFWIGSDWNNNRYAWYMTTTEVGLGDGVGSNNTYVTWEIDLSTTPDSTVGTVDWTAIDAIGIRVYQPSGNTTDYNIFIDRIYTDATIEDTGTTVTLTKFVCNQTDPKERCDKLAEIMGWIYYYRADTDKVYFQPKQFNTNSTTLEVGVNVVNVPKWKYDKSDLINDLRLDGVFQERNLEETFSGDGSTTDFTLAYQPVGEVKVYEESTKNYTSASPVQSELKTLGVADSPIGSYDYTLDKSTKKISFETAPDSGTNSIMVRYGGAVEVPVHITDDVSVSTYGTHARNIVLTDVITVADAEARVLEVLEKFSVPFQSAVLEVKNESGVSFQIGDQVHVVDAKNNPNVDDYFTTFGITLNYPDGFDEIKVGDREFEPPEYFINIGERLHRLEKGLITEGTILTELKKTSMEMTWQPHDLTIKQEYINDSFILGHDDNGKVYSSSNALILSDFENLAHWAEASGSETLTEAANSTSGHYVEGTQGIKYTWTSSSGTGIIENTQSQGDLSGVSGVSSGTPSQGTAGVWIYMTEGADISEVRLRIGSSSTDYKEYIGQTYGQKVANTESSFSIEDAKLMYVLFDLDSPDATSGTVDWTAIDFMQLRWTISAAGDATFDYLTASKNNSIALNGLGERFTTYSEATTTY